MHNKRESWLILHRRGWCGDFGQGTCGRLVGEDDGLVAEDLRGIRSTRRGAIDLRAGRAR